MMTAVLAVLCLYLATCYAYGGYLLVGVVRGKRAEAPADGHLGPGVGPQAGVRHAAQPPVSPAGAGTKAAPHDESDAPVRAAA